MAAIEDARNVPPGINLKCHPERAYNYVTCVLCDEPFCKSDLSRKVSKGKGFFISNTLVVCPEHNLTYNQSHVNDMTDDEYDVNKVLKLKIELMQKEYENLNLNDTILSSDTSNEENDGVTSEVESVLTVNSLCKQMKILKIHNKELTQHNNELTESNKFLRNLCDNKKNETNLSYAATLKPNNINEKIEDCTTIVLKPVKNFEGEAIKVVKNSITKSVKEPIIGIRKGRNNEVTVNCSKLSSQKIKDKLIKELGKDMTVEFLEKRNPLIRVFNVENDMDQDELIKDIIYRNNLETKDFTINYIYKNNRNNTRNLIMSVLPETYMKIKNSKGIYIGYERHNFIDDFNLNRCKKCQGYNHTDKKCIREDQCSKCAGSHNSESCNVTNTIACINCIKANKFLKKKRNINHEASDIYNCETYKLKWNQVVNSTNYPVKPELFKRKKEKNSETVAESKTENSSHNE